MDHFICAEGVVMQSDASLWSGCLTEMMIFAPSCDEWESTSQEILCVV